MIADDGSPILMDLGSIVRARVEIRSRQEALLQQDLASEHSSMPYRAPELFDVKTNTTLDEKVDIWVRRFQRETCLFALTDLDRPRSTGPRLHAFRSRLLALTL